MRIIEYRSGKKKLELVAGLVWHPLHLTGSARKGEIREIAKSSGFDFQVMRGTESPHVGFAKKSDGAKAGHYSVAAVVADYVQKSNKSGNFLVALKVPGHDDQYIYVASHDGVILADGDVVDTGNLIRARLSGDSAYEAWETIICPSEWGISNSREVGFFDIFTAEDLKNPRRWMLKEITLSLSRLALPTLIVCLLIGGGIFGTNYYKQKQLEAAIAAENLRLEQEAAAKGLLSPAAQEAPKPWVSVPSAQSFAEACSAAMAQLDRNGGNWQFKSAVCADGSLTASWSKPNELAWISHFKAIQPQSEFSLDGLTATVRIPAVALPKPASENLPDYKASSQRYIDLGSRLGISLRLDPLAVQPTPVLLPNQPPSAVPPPAWASFNLAAMTHLDPVEVARELAAPGLRIQKITYGVTTTGAMQYEISGVQYVKP